MSKVLTNNDFKDPIALAKFAKDYWQIREEIAHMYKLKRRTNDYKEQLDLDKTIKVLRMMLAKHYTIGLIQTVQIRNAIEDERKHRYDRHNSPSHWYEHAPHR
ncbi:MAG: hypothetical protein ACI4OP_00440 [Candidatus Coprovivens sp.]